MYIVTLEGLPHAARTHLLRLLASKCPSWHLLDVPQDTFGAAQWASSTSWAGHCVFAALMHKLSALSRRTPTRPPVMLLSAPWYEHVPAHLHTKALLRDMTHELIAKLDCRVDGHVLVMLQVPHNEAFEHMVCSCNPYWNTFSWGDVAAHEDCIGRHLCELATNESGEGHPFPHRVVRVACPAFVEEDEVTCRCIVSKIKAAVEAFSAV